MASDPADRNQNAPPGIAANRIKPHSQPLSQNDEGHHGKPYKGADQQR